MPRARTTRMRARRNPRTSRSAYHEKQRREKARKSRVRTRAKETLRKQRRQTGAKHRKARGLTPRKDAWAPTPKGARIGRPSPVSSQTWRGSKGELGDDVIFEIFPNVELVMAAEFNPGTVDWGKVFNAITGFYLQVQLKLHGAIGRKPLGGFRDPVGKVPSDTGALRGSMWAAISTIPYTEVFTIKRGKRTETVTVKGGQVSSKVGSSAAVQSAAKNGRSLARMVLNTAGVYWANPVDHYPTKTLSHPHAGQWRGRNPPLRDPHAITSWYEQVLATGRGKAKSRPLLQGLRTNAGGNYFMVVFK